MAVSLAAATGCKGGKDLDAAGLTGTPSADSSPSPSPSPSPTPSPSPPVGTVSDTSFNVSVYPNPKVSYKIHEGTGALGAMGDDFTKPCEVTSSSVNKDITCIVEAQELDLYFHGVKIHYNVPTTMCSYVRVNRPYYYEYKPANAPTSILVNNSDTNLIVGATTVLPGEVYVDGALAASDSRGGLSTIKGGYNGSTAFCATDYSNSKNPYSPTLTGGGPNCCAGAYSLTIRSEGNADPDSNATTSGEWTGKPSACVSGPGTDLQGKDVLGYPALEISYAEGVGINSAYDVKAPIELGRASNMYIASFYDTTQHGGSTPLPYTTIGTLPAMNPYHEFVCLDRSYEFQARIRVMVREWNLASEFALNNLGDPNSTGNEVGYGTPPKNDFWDFFDLENWTGGLVPAYPRERSDS